MHSINVETDAEKLGADLLAGLKTFNEGIAGPYNDQPLSLSIRDVDGTLLAGLSGLTYWNMLHIHLLWVDQAHRRSGYGSALLDEAERIAVERGCEVVYLDTYQFQAPAFYAKRGYTAFGELNDAPRGFRTTWFSKRLISQS